MEQVGVKYVGVTAFKQLVTSVSNLQFISAVIVGNVNASYKMGLALRDGGNGLKVPYTNAIAVNDYAVGTGNGSTTTFNLGHANVIAETLKVYSAGNQKNVSISKGTGTGGVDQVVFAVAPANGEAILADYMRYDNPVGATGACILTEDVTTTVGGGNVTTDGLIAGAVKGSMVVDGNGNPVDAYFKAQLPMVRFE